MHDESRRIYVQCKWEQICLGRNSRGEKFDFCVTRKERKAKSFKKKLRKEKKARETQQMPESNVGSLTVKCGLKNYS
jgi:hypothetical protein